MTWVETLDTHWWWLIFAVMLGIGEIILPGIFLIWIAAAAAATGLLSFLLPIGTAVQMVIFALLCLLATWAGRRWYADNPVASSDPLLNDRTARLIGEIVTVVEPIENGRGRVRVDDGVWSCRGGDAPVGARVRIVGADASVLMVEPA
ncbi:NfeD family protein [Sphingobium aromaticiconvertens]|uniref:NfeD family protein n=1 Tax=Sphingobium aromaticiconvertens TaxID=365341 RepID=UPI0030169F3E